MAEPEPDSPRGVADVFVYFEKPGLLRQDAVEEDDSDSDGEFGCRCFSCGMVTNGSQICRSCLTNPMSDDDELSD